MNNRLSLLIVILTVSLGSCTRDKLEPCPTNSGSTQITYSYTLNDEQTNLYDTKVKRVSIFVFDAMGGFLFNQSVTEPSLIKNDLPIVLDLPVGRYTIVSLGGNSHLYASQLDGGTLAQFRLSANVNGNDVVTIDEFFGAGSTEIVVEPNKVSHYAIPMIRNTHKLNITVTGVANLPTKVASPIVISVTGNNLHFRADNTVLAHSSMLNYAVGDHLVQNDQVSVSLPIFRLYDGSNVRIKITEPSSGFKVADFDLATALRATPVLSTQTDVDRKESYDILLNVDTQTKVTMKVNGWDVVDVGIISHM